MSLPPIDTICLITKPGPWLRGTVTLPATVTGHRPPYLRLEDAEGAEHYRRPDEVELLGAPEAEPELTGFGPLWEVAR